MTKEILRYYCIDGLTRTERRTYTKINVQMELPPIPRFSEGPRETEPWGIILLRKTHEGGVDE